jgi:ferritin
MTPTEQFKSEYLAAKATELAALIVKVNKSRDDERKARKALDKALAQERASLKKINTLVFAMRSETEQEYAEFLKLAEIDPHTLRRDYT